MILANSISILEKQANYLKCADCGKELKDWTKRHWCYDCKQDLCPKCSYLKHRKHDVHN